MRLLFATLLVLWLSGCTIGQDHADDGANAGIDEPHLPAPLPAIAMGSDLKGEAREVLEQQGQQQDSDNLKPTPAGSAGESEASEGTGEDSVPSTPDSAEVPSTTGPDSDVPLEDTAALSTSESTASLADPGSNDDYAKGATGLRGYEAMSPAELRALLAAETKRFNLRKRRLQDLIAAREKALTEEAARKKAEQKRLAEEKRREEARKAAEQKRAEEARVREERKKKGLERGQDAVKKREEAAKKLEDAKRADEEQKKEAAKRRAAEMQRLATEAWRAEEKRRAERKRAQEERAKRKAQKQQPEL